jgi:hypothetical protein
MLRLRKLLPTAALVGLMSVGLAVGTAGTASAGPASCGDFFKILAYYESVGDQATAGALFDNMKAHGC